MYVTDVMDIAQRISGFRNRLEVALKVFMEEKLFTSKMKSGPKGDNNEMLDLECSTICSYFQTKIRSLKSK